MKASPEHQRLLLEVQSMDTHDRQLDYTSAHLPEFAVVRELTTLLEESAADFIMRQGAVEDLQREIERIESDVAVVVARIATDIERQSHTSNAKDAQAIEAELASLRSRHANLEDIELEVMERLEAAETSLAELREKRESLHADIDAAERASHSSLAAISDERAELLRNRTALVAQLPADLIELYERQRHRYGIGAALPTRGVSGGSGMALSETDLSQIRAAAADDVVLCPDSSCILIRTEESGL